MQKLDILCKYKFLKKFKSFCAALKNFFRNKGKFFLGWVITQVTFCYRFMMTYQSALSSSFSQHKGTIDFSGEKKKVRKKEDPTGSRVF